MIETSGDVSPPVPGIWRNEATAAAESEKKTDTSGDEVRELSWGEIW